MFFYLCWWEVRFFLFFLFWLDLGFVVFFGDKFGDSDVVVIVKFII